MNVFFGTYQEQEHIPIVSDDIECLTTQVDELMEFLCRSVSPVYHISHVRCQYKWRPVPKIENENRMLLQRNSF